MLAGGAFEIEPITLAREGFHQTLLVHAVRSSAGAGRALQCHILLCFVLLADAAKNIVAHGGVAAVEFGVL